MNENKKLSFEPARMSFSAPSSSSARFSLAQTPRPVLNSGGAGAKVSTCGESDESRVVCGDKNAEECATTESDAMELKSQPQMRRPMAPIAETSNNNNCQVISPRTMRRKSVPDTSQRWIEDPQSRRLFAVPSVQRLRQRRMSTPLISERVELPPRIRSIKPAKGMRLDSAPPG